VRGGEGFLGVSAAANDQENAIGFYGERESRRQWQPCWRRIDDDKFELGATKFGEGDRRAVRRGVGRPGLGGRGRGEWREEDGAGGVRM